MFVVFYSVSIVAGNVLFATPIGADLLALTGFPTESLTFKTTFTLGYWALLLMPLVAVPLLVPHLKRFLKPALTPLLRAAPDFTKAEYVAVASVSYGIAVWAFWWTGAIDLASSAHDGIAAVEARFELQERMHFLEKIVIHAILPFLAFYALAAALRTGGWFWGSVAIFNTIAVIFVLIGVNMKWPALLFMIALVVALFMFSSRYAYLKTLAGTVFLVGFYLVLSTYVFRAVAPEPMAALESIVAETPPASSFTSVEQAPASPTPSEEAEGLSLIKPSPAEYTEDLLRSSARLAPELFAHAVNRMAISYPYYYNVFTEEGRVCGGVLDQARTSENVSCRPSWLIYTRIFGSDGFEGRGTAPAASHITGYALGGWAIALLGTLGICLVLAAFSAIPINASIMGSALAVVGATAGYHLSQIPGEGVVFYDHGFIWPVSLVAMYAIIRNHFCKNLNPETVYH